MPTPLSTSSLRKRFLLHADHVHPIQDSHDSHCPDGCPTAKPGIPGNHLPLRAPPPPPPCQVRLTGGRVTAPGGIPEAVGQAIAAGHVLQTKSYKYGGGRDTLEDSGYDCSGAVSSVLIKAGLLDAPLTSAAFQTDGEPGPGRWITIHAKAGHVFMTICGVRLDTGTAVGAELPDRAGAVSQGPPRGKALEMTEYDSIFCLSDLSSAGLPLLMAFRWHR